MLPEGVAIDPLTGAMSSSTGEYSKRLSEFRGVYRDSAALEKMLAERGDIETYRVVEHRQPGSDIFFGTTTMAPGKVGYEYFMTRGHYHERRDRGEIYYTQSGSGLLLLQSRQGDVRTVEMKPGTCAFIPPDWAHRSVNTGSATLVFVWCCNQDAGHDYAEIAARGMRQLVLDRNGSVTLAPNPNY